MPPIRDEIVRKLWRGKDPFRSSRADDGMPDLQGWGSEHKYLTDAIETHRPSIVVEVGVWKGASVIRMASRLRDLAIDGVVIAVDTWLGSWEHWGDDGWFRELGVLESDRSIVTTFLRNVRSACLENYIVPLPLDSVNAAQVLRHFNIVPDVAHIDGGHDYAAVLADLKQWWPLLKPGGLLIGDDYRAGNNWPGVKRAFDDYFRPLGLIPLENTQEKCRVSKPKTDQRASRSLAAMKLTGSTVSKWRESLRLELQSLIENEATGVAEELERYVRFCGPEWPSGRQRLMDKLAAKLSAGGRQLSRGDIFGVDGQINVAAVQAMVPGFNAHYLRATGTEGLERFELLPEFENPFTRFALPDPLNRNMARAKAPSFAVYRTRRADLFLTPIGYQLFRAAEGLYWPAASTRAYPQEAMGFQPIAMDRCLVIVQDGFEGSNFSHFLFDWVSRIGHFVNAGLEDPSSCTFVMGGIPIDFHFYVIQALCEIYSLREEQFIFPQEPQIWHNAGPIYFFSDFRAGSMHPANMAHRRSMAIVREVCSRIATPSGDIKRVYISRGDTPLRRIANERELFLQLKSFGFVQVQLASLPWLEQVALSCAARMVIVAPHGMGLTHLAFHEGQPLIVELHNPVIGTDTYAFPARALGFRYRACMLGTDLGGFTNHFNISRWRTSSMYWWKKVCPLRPRSAIALCHDYIPSFWLGSRRSLPPRRST